MTVYGPHWALRDALRDLIAVIRGFAPEATKQPEIADAIVLGERVLAITGGTESSRETGDMAQKVLTNAFD